MAVTVPRISSLNQLWMITMHTSVTPASKSDDIWNRVNETFIYSCVLCVNSFEKKASMSVIAEIITSSKVVTCLGFSTLS